MSVYVRRGVTFWLPTMAGSVRADLGSWQAREGDHAVADRVTEVEDPPPEGSGSRAVARAPSRALVRLGEHAEVTQLEQSRP